MPSFAIGNVEANAAKSVVVVDRVFLVARCAFIELEIALNTFSYTYTCRQKACLIDISGYRNGTDAINEPSLAINRFPLETVIHRRLALS